MPQLRIRKVAVLGAGVRPEPGAVLGAGGKVATLLDLGDVEVRVPREGNVVVNAHVDLGEIKTPSGDREGMDLDHTWSRVDDPAAPTRTIEVEVGLGEVVVRP